MGSSTQDRLNNWNTDEARKYIVHDVFLVFYFFVGVVGNAVVLIVYQTKLKKKSDSRYFFPFLALFDLFACGFRAPFELWKTLLPVNSQDILSCQIIWWIVNVFTFSSIYLLAVITFQRYRKVCRPFGFQLTLNVRRCCLVGVFILAICFASPFIIWNEKLEIQNPEKNITGYICGANVLKVDKSSNTFLVFILFLSLVFVFVMVVLVVLNLFILRSIYITLKNKMKRENETRKYAESRKWSTSTQDVESTASFQNSCVFSISKDVSSCEPASSSWEQTSSIGHRQDNSQKHSSSSSVTRVSYMVMVISLAFILSCIPQISLLFSLCRNRYFWVENTETEAIIFRFMDHMMIINNIVNPYVYGYFDLKFRQAAKDIFYRFCWFRTR